MSTFELGLVGVGVLCQTLICETWDAIERLLWKHFFSAQETHTWLFITECFGLLAKSTIPNLANHYCSVIIPDLLQFGTISVFHHRLSYLFDYLVHLHATGNLSLDYRHIWGKFAQLKKSTKQMLQFQHHLLKNQTLWKLAPNNIIKDIIDNTSRLWESLCSRLESETLPNERIVHLQIFHYILDPILYIKSSAGQYDANIQLKIKKINDMIKTTQRHFISACTKAAQLLSSEQKSTAHIQHNMISLLQLLDYSQHPNAIEEIRQWLTIPNLQVWFWIKVIEFFASAKSASINDTKVVVIYLDYCPSYRSLHFFK
jgi:hypothetical protein